MNKNILFGIIMLFVVIASVSSVSAWWIFGGGNDVTVNGVDFHLPEGFDADNPINAESDATYGRAVYKNSENGNTIDIAVDDQSVDESVIENSLIKKGFEAKNIDGKDGFYNFYLSKNVEFVYIDNNKVISIIVPFIYDKYGDNVMKYEDLLAEIIK